MYYRNKLSKFRIGNKDLVFTRNLDDIWINDKEINLYLSLDNKLYAY